MEPTREPPPGFNVGISASRWQPAAGLAVFVRNPGTPAVYGGGAAHQGPILIEGGQGIGGKALYATDATDGRISAYYLAHYLELLPPAKDPVKVDLQDNSAVSAQIPNALVHTWLNNWKAASPVTATMFGSSYGPLTGYTFDMGDFLNSFFYANKFKNKELLVLFGLHQHYPAFPDCYALKQTFGLVLRINQLANDSSKPVADFPTDYANFFKATENTTSHAELLKAVKLWLAENDDPIGQPFYDYSKPSPPY